MSTTARISELEGRMTRQDYRTWLEQQQTGRYERIGGVVVAMAPKRIRHIRIKARIWQAPRNRICGRGLRGSCGWCNRRDR